MLDELNNTTEAVETQQQPVEEKNNDKEANLARLRERAEAAERRLQELENERMRAQEQKANNTSRPPQDDYDIDDDMYLEGRHFKKAFQPIKQQLDEARQQYSKTQAELEEMKRQRMLADAEQRVQQKFPDFSSVVNQENLRKLELTDPEAFNAIRDTQDVYSKAAVAYKLIKSANVLDPAPEQEERIASNQQKPRSAAGMGGQSASTSPLSRVGDYDRRVMTPERRAELQRMMQQYKQG